MNELVSLTDAKAALYEALQPFSLSGCFLRFSDTPEGLLVCDLPRRGGDLAGAEEALAQEIAEDDEHHGEVDGKIDEIDRERRGVQAEQGGGILDEIAEQEQIERQVAPAGDGCRAAEAVAEGGFFRHGSLLRASV